jgi:hypothetical protein
MEVPIPQRRTRPQPSIQNPFSIPENRPPKVRRRARALEARTETRVASQLGTPGAFDALASAAASLIKSWHSLCQ